MSTSETVTDLRALKEKRRLERSTELILPISQGWDVQISTRASSEETAKSPWAVYATRVTSSPSPESSLASPTAGSFPETSSSPSSEPAYDHIVFRVAHTKLQGHSILKVKLIVELSGGASGLRINGVPHTIEDAESRDPSSYTMPKQMLEDATSISGISYQTASTAGSGSSATPSAQAQVTPKKSGERSPAADKTILTLVRRNYIYFTSLLQEPEAKWRHIIEGRGVTISKLDTIDPTLVVYRAEAVFVGVGVWDLYSTIKTPGAKVYWDRGFDDGVLLEDVNELSELWHVSQKAAWPVNARDSVVLTTSYKSPTAIHVFSFSVDDRQLFSSIPTPDIATIRTQVDLHGWAIEALSPTTTLLTLLDQSDPKGWSNKSSIPQQMIATMAGVGEYAIKCGGPPISTRLGGAKFTQMKYDHERGTFKVEYEGSDARRSSASGQESVGFTPTASTTDLIEPTVDTGTVSKINTGLMPKIESTSAERFVS
ncbi:hypothetical protein FRC02_001155 [Tulasnella sp. 418]|nr:hypothetical protein FRC02_001155 [Tulasnella sp. 418]